MATVIHKMPIGTCKRRPITEALWKIDNGPNCLTALFMSGLRAFTRRKCAQLQIKMSTHDKSPSKVETFVIFHPVVANVSANQIISMSLLTAGSLSADNIHVTNFSFLTTHEK